MVAYPFSWLTLTLFVIGAPHATLLAGYKNPHRRKIFRHVEEYVRGNVSAFQTTAAAGVSMRS